MPWDVALRKQRRQKSDPLPSDRPAPHEAKENDDSGPSPNPSQAPFTCLTKQTGKACWGQTGVTKFQQYLINVYLNIRAGERNKMKQDDVSGKRRNSLDGTNFCRIRHNHIEYI